MILWDLLNKRKRFKKENEILSRIDGCTEYCENCINGVFVEQNVCINGESVKTSLEARRKYIEAYAAEERLKRERAAVKLTQKGQLLSPDVIRKLCDAEDKKRFEALKHIKEMPGR